MSHWMTSGARRLKCRKNSQMGKTSFDTHALQRAAAAGKTQQNLGCPVQGQRTETRDFETNNRGSMSNVKNQEISQGVGVIVSGKVEDVSKKRKRASVRRRIREGAESSIWKSGVHAVVNSRLPHRRIQNGAIFEGGIASVVEALPTETATEDTTCTAVVVPYTSLTCNSTMQHQSKGLQTQKIIQGNGTPIPPPPFANRQGIGFCNSQSAMPPVYPFVNSAHARKKVDACSHTGSQFSLPNIRKNGNGASHVDPIGITSCSIATTEAGRVPRTVTLSPSNTTVAVMGASVRGNKCDAVVETELGSSASEAVGTVLPTSNGQKATGVLQSYTYHQQQQQDLRLQEKQEIDILDGFKDAANSGLGRGNCFDIGQSTVATVPDSRVGPSLETNPSGTRNGPIRHGCTNTLQNDMLYNIPGGIMPFYQTPANAGSFVGTEMWGQGGSNHSFSGCNARQQFVPFPPHSLRATARMTTTTTTEFISPFHEVVERHSNFSGVDLRDGVTSFQCQHHIQDGTDEFGHPWFGEHAAPFKRHRFSKFHVDSDSGTTVELSQGLYSGHTNGVSATATLRRGASGSSTNRFFEDALCNGSEADPGNLGGKACPGNLGGIERFRHRNQSVALEGASSVATEGIVFQNDGNVKKKDMMTDLSCSWELHDQGKSLAKCRKQVVRFFNNGVEVDETGVPIPSKTNDSSSRENEDPPRKVPSEQPSKGLLEFSSEHQVQPRSDLEESSSKLRKQGTEPTRRVVSLHGSETIAGSLSNEITYSPQGLQFNKQSGHQASHEPCQKSTRALHAGGISFCGHSEEREVPTQYQQDKVGLDKRSTPGAQPMPVSTIERRSAAVTATPGCNGGREDGSYSVERAKEPRVRCFQGDMMEQEPKEGKTASTRHNEREIKQSAGNAEPHESCPDTDETHPITAELPNQSWRKPCVVANERNSLSSNCSQPHPNNITNLSRASKKFVADSQKNRSTTAVTTGPHSDLLGELFSDIVRVPSPSSVAT